MTQVDWTQEFRTIATIHQGLDQSRFSVRELIQSYLNAAHQSHLGAYLTLCDERALAQAHAADELLAKKGQVIKTQKPLLGIPIGIKDILALDGVRMTCGSKLLGNYISPYTATAVERLESAGAIILGKLNLDEFSMGGSNENSAYGPVQHPTHPGYVPGGSSGGPAAAVKAGLCVAALGTDTGGSIRLPASYCGVVGIKPTYGRVSRFGLVAYASSLDQIGPISNSVEDAAILLDVISGHDPLDSTSCPLPATEGYTELQSKVQWDQIRIGVPQEYFVDGISEEVRQAVENSIQSLKAQGAKIIPISLPHTSYVVAVYYIVAVSEASSNLARFDGIRYGIRPDQISGAKNLSEFYEIIRSNFGPEVKRRIILGTFALSSGYSEAYYLRACQVRRKIKEDFDQAFKQVDFIVGPVSPTPPYRIGEKINDPLQMYLNDIFTIPANLAGLPAMSIPCGKSSEGLPIGLHLIAPHFQDEKLLGLANAFSILEENLSHAF